MTMTPQSMRVAMVETVIAFVREGGGNPGRMLGRLGLTEDGIRDGSRLPSFSEELELWELAAAETEDPYFGLHLAQRIQRGMFGMLDFVCRSATTLGEALDIVVRYYPAFQPEMLVTTYTMEDVTIVQQELRPPRRTSRQVNEFFVTLVVLQGQLLSRTRFKPLRVWFASVRPASVAELSDIMQTGAIEFDAASTGVAFDKSSRQLAVATSDPPLHSVLSTYIQNAFPSPSANDLIVRARRLIADTLYQREPRIEWIARILGVSVRTLQRQLAAQSSNFRDLVENVREELARTYLHDQSRPIGEIPYLLGYSNPRQFFRSFKRWTGMTPGNFRDTVQQPH